MSLVNKDLHIYNMSAVVLHWGIGMNMVCYVTDARSGSTEHATVVNNTAIIKMAT
jgi:hypothetical protein